jgi:DNA-binding XRE family transcriptional regulator
VLSTSALIGVRKACEAPRSTAYCKKIGARGPLHLESSPTSQRAAARGARPGSSPYRFISTFRFRATSFIEQTETASLVMMKRAPKVKPQWAEAGHWLKELRAKAGFTQSELASRLGVKHYSYISQIEAGICRVPTNKLKAWAQLLDIDPTVFARRLISYYQPELYRLLYGSKRS